jgi:TRAP-type C4-dicarboxylate transport system substrate-binding protein
MKKALPLALALLLAVSLFAGCGSTDTSDDAEPTEAPAETNTDSSGTDTSGTDSSAEDWDFSNDQKYELSFALYLPASNPAFDWLQPFVDDIKERTDGTVSIEVFPGSTLCAGSETVEAIRSGVADMGYNATGFSSGVMVYSYMAELPLHDYGSAKAASYAYNEWLNTEKPAELDDFKLIFGNCSGPGIILTNGKALKSIDDFSGMQIHANACNSLAINAYGGTALTLEMSEIYEALRTGVIDGYSGLVESITGYKFYEVAEYATRYPFLQVATQVLMNKEVWDSMSEGQQAVIDAVAQEQFEKTACCYLERDHYEPAYQACLDNGLELITLDDETLAEMKEKAGNIVVDYAASLDKQGYNATEALNELDRLIAHYNEIYPTND